MDSVTAYYLSHIKKNVVDINAGNITLSPTVNNSSL